MNRTLAPLAAILWLVGAPAAAQRLDYERLGYERVDEVGRWQPPRLGYAPIELEAAAVTAAVRRPPTPVPGDGEANERVREFYLDRTEILAQRGPEVYTWDWSAYIGGNIHRLYLASTGDGTLGGPLDYLEMQALYSRSLGNFDLQAGVRWDIVPRPRRVYLTAGAQGYVVEDAFYLGAMLFLSHEGELTGRLFGTYDIPLVSRLTLQPAFEAEIAAQDVPDLGIGSGPIYGEAGLRLRYRLAPGESDAFTPYIGVHYERLLGRSARFAREEEEDVGGWSFLAGIRSWF